MLAECGSALGRVVVIGWYAAEVHNHRLSVDHLTRQGIVTFDPKIKTERMSRGRRVQSIRQYIPGYVFVQFDVEAQAWRFINSTVGVKRLISAGEIPVRIPDNSMGLLLERCCDGFVDDPAELDRALLIVGKGDELRVIDGPFSGFHATATRKQLGDKVWLSLSIFGRQTLTMLPRKSVEIIPPPLGPKA